MDKAFLEITNTCNLACRFCHGTERSPRVMTAKEFDVLTDRLRGEVKYLYFHLMGEPLLHPLLPDFVRKAREKGFRPMITTNGTLLGGEVGTALAETLPYKVSVSLQSFEGNPAEYSAGLDPYLGGCIRFAKEAAPRGTIVVFRLWNLGGESSGNGAILEALHAAYPGEWHPNRSGFSLADKTFLEWGEAFEWPDVRSAAPTEGASPLFCYALRDQFGVLADGTVVPCCLDADGAMALGNLFETDLRAILASPRALAIYNGFTRHEAVEPMCRSCGYARETKRYRSGGK